MQNLKEMAWRARVRIYGKLTMWSLGFVSAMFSLPLVVISLLNTPYSVASEVEPTSAFPHWLSSYTVFMASLTPQTPVITGVELLLDALDGTLYTRYLVKPDALFLLAFGAVLLVSFATWLFMYYVGLRWHYRLLGLGRRAQLWGLVSSLVVLPLASVLETAPSVYGLYRWLRKKPMQWQITKK